MSIPAISGSYPNDAFGAFKPTSNDSSGAIANQGSKETKASQDTAKLSQIASSKTQDKQPTFLDRLNSLTSKPKPSMEQMQARYNDIQLKGKVLLHHPKDSVVKSYMKEVKGFLTDLRDHAYGSKHRDDLFERIDVLDSKLDKLAEEFIAGQQNELALVNSLGELQGILIDIYV